VQGMREKEEMVAPGALLLQAGSAPVHYRFVA
jgi:hypothetical protein